VTNSVIILFDFNKKISFYILFLLFDFPFVLAQDLSAVVLIIEQVLIFVRVLRLSGLPVLGAFCFGFFSALASSRRQISVFVSRPLEFCRRAARFLIRFVPRQVPVRAEGFSVPAGSCFVAWCFRSRFGSRQERRPVLWLSAQVVSIFPRQSVERAARLLLLFVLVCACLGTCSLV
jgi:hypothetical protein